MAKQSEKKNRLAHDEVVQMARDLIKEMPGWQRAYAEEVIKSATEPASPRLASLPKMLS
jgi:hypothetical protein